MSSARPIAIVFVANSEVIKEETYGANFDAIVTTSDTDVGLNSVTNGVANVNNLRLKSVETTFDSSSREGHSYRVRDNVNLGSLSVVKNGFNKFTDGQDPLGIMSQL